jgi:hypothetical protein
MTYDEFRNLLAQAGSHLGIQRAALSGDLHCLRPSAYLEHTGEVYRPLEIAAHADLTEGAALKLAVLVHEDSTEGLPAFLEAGGFSDLTNRVIELINGFGELWKVKDSQELESDVRSHRAYLRTLLLFELAHEGRSTPMMKEAARFAGLEAAFERWTLRLPHCENAAHRLMP